MSRVGSTPPLQSPLVSRRGREEGLAQGRREGAKRARLISSAAMDANGPASVVCKLYGLKCRMGDEHYVVVCKV